MKNVMDYSFAAWRERMGWTKEQAHLALGISRTYYWRMEKESVAPPVYCWAAYGLEVFQQKQGVQNGQNTTGNA